MARNSSRQITPRAPSYASVVNIPSSPPPQYTPNHDTRQDERSSLLPSFQYQTPPSPDHPYHEGFKQQVHVPRKVYILLVAMFSILSVLVCLVPLMMMSDIPLSEKREMRRQWEAEKVRHSREMDRWRTELSTIRLQHHKVVEAYEEARKAYERAREEWERERQEEERRRKDMERRRQGVFWTEPWKNSGCRAHGTQSYSADFHGLPGDLNSRWHEVCMDTPITIHGRRIEGPTKCERNDRGIWGTWYVDFDEPQCTTFWNNVEYKGCIGGMNRWEARLMNLRHGDNWDTMCATTPITLDGVRYDRPSACIDIGGNGRIGVWESTCR